MEILLIIGLSLLVVIALYNGLVVRRYTIKSNKIKNEMKVVVVSDLHSSQYGKDQSKIISKIEALKPDLILLPGDIVDDRKPPTLAFLFLKALPGIAPTYYVSGNHENIQSKAKELFLEIQKMGIQVLDYNISDRLNIKGNDLHIFGVPDPREYNYHDLSEVAEKQKMALFSTMQAESSYKILLAHRPEKPRRDQYLAYGFDLIVSGHAHGGQMRVPGLINGLYAPHQGIFPKFAGGQYIEGDQNHIVGRGASFFWRFPRIFNPPEIVLIHIHSKE